MNDNQNLNNMGEQFKSALTDALQKGNFKDLNELVSQTVTDTLDEVGRQITQGMPNQNNMKAEDRTDMPVWEQRARQREQQKQLKIQQEWQEQLRRRQEEMQKKQVPARGRRFMDTSLVKLKKIGSVSGVLYQIFGGIGLGITGMVTFVRFLMTLSGHSTLNGWIINFIFLAFFFGMVQIGTGQGRRIRRAERYIQLCDYRMYGQIADLARGTGRSERYVLKDIRNMMKRGMFPEGHLDVQETCFMLNDVVYRQYQETEKNRELREREIENSQQADRDIQQAEVSGGQQEDELNVMVAEGMECIRRLRDLNDRISEESISAKLYRLENLLKDIFDGVKEHPEQMNRMHKMMDYYLPTTLKLVEAYEEFDRVSAPGPEILEAKAEIGKTLDTINQAFTELLNKLFQDAVFDATTDAQVLKTMLAREGLMREMELVKAGWE